MNFHTVRCIVSTLQLLCCPSSKKSYLFFLLSLVRSQKYSFIGYFSFKTDNVSFYMKIFYEHFEWTFNAACIACYWRDLNGLMENISFRFKSKWSFNLQQYPKFNLPFFRVVCQNIVASQAKNESCSFCPRCIFQSFISLLLFSLLQ